jgi:hypothetical protein
MDKIDVVAEFKRSLSAFYGYDEKLKYVGSKKPQINRQRPRRFWNLAISSILQSRIPLVSIKKKIWSTASATAREQSTPKSIA